MTPERHVLAADYATDRSQVARRILVLGLVVFAILQPVVNLLGRPLDARGWFQVIGAVVLTGLVCWRLGTRKPASYPVPWLSLAVTLALGISLFTIGGENWLATLAVTAAVFGVYSQTPAPALIGATVCGVAGLTVAAIDGYQSGLIVAAGFIAPMAGLFSYSAARRADAVDMLKRTRAELARAAAAEERLRIARDLHDLLGHSLSLITLKAELAGRVIEADPSRAAREIAEVEGVARQSLADVRAAVAGFRQPDLAAELAGARQLLDAAGITSTIRSMAEDLPQDVDGVLAWTVREGATNVVRHSKATHVAITIAADQCQATAEIRDDGLAARARSTFAGSGLAGLGERVRSLGGELAAGAIEPRGFRLRVAVPSGAPATASRIDIARAPGAAGR